jgi:hypothetical protein
MHKFTLCIIALSMASLWSCEKEPANGEECGSESWLITIQPGPEDGKDAFVEDYPYSNYRNLNWGGSDEFAAISWTAQGVPYVVRSFLEFNFAAVPEKAIIDSARLSLFAYGNEGHGYGHDTLTGSNESYLLRVLTEWDENSVTWNEQPETTEHNQVLLPGSNHPMQDYIGIDVTGLVRDIHDHPGMGFGFMLRLKHETGYRRLMFASSDANEKGMRPKLDIYYSLTTH